MTQDAASAPAQQFTIGNVLGTSFAVLGRNIVAFGVLALGLGVLSLVATLAGAGYMVWTVGSGEASHQILPMILAGVGIFVVFIVVGNLLTATVSYGVFQDLRGQPAGLGGCLARGVASILPIIVASLLFSFLVGLKFILLVVPDVILLLTCWLYIPMIVVENLDDLCCRIALQAGGPHAASIAHRLNIDTAGDRPLALPPPGC